MLSNRRDEQKTEEADRTIMNKLIANLKSKLGAELDNFKQKSILIVLLSNGRAFEYVKATKLKRWVTWARTFHKDW